MLDVVTLALAKKYTDSHSIVVSPEDIEAAVDQYLEEHPVQPTPIDDTLSISGEAADAKAVGDAIQELKDVIQDLRQLIVDITQEEDVAEGIVNSGTEALTSEDVSESYEKSLN